MYGAIIFHMRTHTRIYNRHPLIIFLFKYLHLRHQTKPKPLSSGSDKLFDSPLKTKMRVFQKRKHFAAEGEWQRVQFQAEERDPSPGARY